MARRRGRDSGKPINLRAEQSASVVQGVLSAIAIVAVVGALSTPAALQAEEPDDILWMSSVAEPTPFAAQLHRDGSAWVMLRGWLPGKVGRAELKVALRRPPQLYEQLHAALRTAGVERGVTLEVGFDSLLGIAPARLTGPQDATQAHKDLVKRFKNSLCPAAEDWTGGWKRILDATDAASEGQILTERARLSVTLRDRDGTPQGSSTPEGLVSQELIRALRDGPWSDSASLISYVVEFKADGAHRVLVTFPEDSPVLINGKELETAGPFRPEPSRTPHMRTMAGQLGGRDVHFHLRQGPPAHVWIFPATALWFPAALWASAPDLEMSYALNPKEIVRARLKKSDREMHICDAGNRCSTIDVADARGFAARAFGECKAASGDLGRASKRANGLAPELFVRIGGQTCALKFRTACLKVRRPGLDRVIDVLYDRSIVPIGFPTPVPRYPLCGRTFPGGE